MAIILAIKKLVFKPVQNESSTLCLKH